MQALAIPEREIAFGAIDQHFHRSVCAGQPRGEPHQIARIAALGGEKRHQRAQTRTREAGVAVGRIFGEADPGFLECRDELRFRNIQERACQQ